MNRASLLRMTGVAAPRVRRPEFASRRQCAAAGRHGPDQFAAHTATCHCKAAATKRSRCRGVRRPGAPVPVTPRGTARLAAMAEPPPAVALDERLHHRHCLLGFGRSRETARERALLRRGKGGIPVSARLALTPRETFGGFVRDPGVCVVLEQSGRQGLHLFTALENERRAAFRPHQPGPPKP